MFTLIVELRVKPEKLDQFRQAIKINSQASLRDEPGCSHFDVVQDRDDPLHFFLYELYDDEAAFEAHRTAPHFADWRIAATECLQDHDGQRNVFGSIQFAGGAR